MEKQHKCASAHVGSKKTTEHEFEKLYRESYGLVYGYVRARMSCDADAEDVVAEAFMKAAHAFSSFDSSRAKFSTWVITIARNCMVSHFRKSRPTATLDDVPELLIAEDGGQSDVDDRDLAFRLLSVLSDNERMVVLLKYQEGMRNVDVADELGMNVSTVSTILARAIQKMRSCLAGR